MTKVCFSLAILGWAAGLCPAASPNHFLKDSFSRKRLEATVVDSGPGGAGIPASSIQTSKADLAAALGIAFVSGSASTLILDRDGKKYLVDLSSRTIHEADPMPAQGAPSLQERRAESPSLPPTSLLEGSKVFGERCFACHGADGKGIKGVGTPNFTDPQLQASLTDEKILTTIREGKTNTLMPAWAGKLSDREISAVAAYVRSLALPKQAPPAAAVQGTRKEQVKFYQPGDDYVFTLPTGRPVDRHGFYINFSHRFAFDPAFSGPARGADLFGLDGFSLSSFGFRYGVTDRLSVSVYRSPSFIARPIELMTAYNLLDEHRGQHLNASVRFSVDGQNNFSRNYIENLEGIFSKSLTRRAQIYLVPTVSFNNRRLYSPISFRSSAIPNLPGFNSFALGGAVSVDVRPTVALFSEVNPTLVGGRDLGIHRPAYSFGIQKKIWRHAFTFGFTNSPGITVAQRSGTRAAFLNTPSADKPSGLIVGFNLTRQVY